MCVAEVRTRVFKVLVSSAFSSAYSSVCKLLVARCVCVAEVQTRVFNAFVSSAFSIAYSVCLQQKMLSSLAINVRLQCDIVFGDD